MYLLFPYAFCFFKITSKCSCLKSLGINHIYISIIKSDHLFTDANAYLMAHFGSGSTVIHLDDVTCTGTETSLLRCSYDIDTTDCSHAQDAGVRCTPVRKLQKHVHSSTWMCWLSRTTPKVKLVSVFVHTQNWEEENLCNIHHTLYPEWLMLYIAMWLY